MSRLTRKNSSSEENGGRIFYRYHSTDHHQRKRASASKQHEVVSIPGVQRRADRASAQSQQTIVYQRRQLTFRSGPACRAEPWPKCLRHSSSGCDRELQLDRLSRRDGIIFLRAFSPQEIGRQQAILELRWN